MAQQKTGLQWASSCDETVKSLDVEKLGLIHVLETHNKTLAFISQLEKDCTTLQKRQTVKRVQQMGPTIKPLANAADVLSKGFAKPSSLIWGLLALSIRSYAFSAREEFVEMALKTFESLLFVAPKFEVFSSYTSLSRERLKTFGGSTSKSSVAYSNPDLTAVDYFKQLQWIRFQRFFEDSIRKIRKLSEKCQSEAGLELELESTQLAEERFRKLVAGRQEVLTALNRKQLPSGGPTQRSFIIPHPPNPTFTGRDRELEETHQTLQPSDPAIVRGQKAVAICGLGGVGKSQLALKYVYHYRFA
ncbi:hypothetical protein GQ44DRAFT_776032 [Phaeosphaeriaceae sp. PMI808]|nr:hypothetical protein GQ44DRAFT_776032 [Phaeosphaeriaceae sp. PMI808]